MSEYIVFGGTGFLGFNVVKQLIQEGYRPIKIITRKHEIPTHFKDLPVEFIVGDITDIEFVNRVISNNSIVFNLAGIVELTSRKRDLMMKINVVGCRNIVDACINNQAKRLIYVSSVAAIEPPKDSTLIYEPNRFPRENLRNHYAKSKSIASEYVFRKVEEGGLDAIVLYPSAVIGPDDYSISSVGQAVVDYTNKKIKATIKGAYNFVDVRDVARAIVTSITQGRAGEGYLLTGEVITVRELFEVLNTTLNRKKVPPKIPLFLVRLAIPFIELFAFLRKKDPIFTFTTLQTLRNNPNFSNEKAQKELNFNPRSAQESITDTLHWFLDNKPELINKQYRP